MRLSQARKLELHDRHSEACACGSPLPDEPNATGIAAMPTATPYLGGAGLLRGTHADQGQEKKQSCDSLKQREGEAAMLQSSKPAQGGSGD